jgi:hypothetical protein
VRKVIGIQLPIKKYSTRRILLVFVLCHVLFKHEHAGVFYPDIKYEATAKCLISGVWTASVLNGLKTTHLISLLAK